MERLKMNLGITKNLGNFESLRVDVGLERELHKATSEDKAELYKEVLSLLDATVANMTKELT